MAEYEYRARQPMLPNPDERRNPNTPVMDCDDMENWLGTMAAQGWELVTYGATHWHDRLTQDWWIFRRPKSQ